MIDGFHLTFYINIQNHLIYHDMERLFRHVDIYHLVPAIPGPTTKKNVVTGVLPSNLPIAQAWRDRGGGDHVWERTVDPSVVPSR